MKREEFKQKYSKRIYLGDGLCSCFDGFNIMLFAERENGEHWVALEPEVYNNLVEYHDQIYKDAKQLKD